MKNLKLFVFALCLLTMSLVTVSAAEYKDVCKDEAGSKYYVEKANGDHKCFTALNTALASVPKNEKVEIVALDNIGGYATPEVFTKDVTLNLNGYTLSFGTSGSFTVKGANVTIKNGTISAGTNVGTLKVDASDKATTLTIADDVTVTSTASGAAVTITSAENGAVVNLNGEWTVQNELVDCAGEKENLTINLNAEVTGKDTMVSLDAGTTTVNVNGGKYTTNGNVFYLKQGTLNVKGGEITSTENHAISVGSPDAKLKQTLNIAGGEVTSKCKNRYALYFANGAATAETGKYSITKGTLTSGEDAEDEQLPAIYIDNKNFLDTFKAWITGGNFTGSIVGEVAGKDGYKKPAAQAQAILVGNATVSEKDGVVTVGGTHTDTETGKKPEEQAPNTFDAGLTYVGLALSAIGASVVSVRKLKNN